MNAKRLKKIISPFSNLLDQVNAICVLGHESLNTENLLTGSLQGILDLFKAKTGSIFLLAPNAEDLHLKISINMKPKEQEDLVKFLEAKGKKLILDPKQSLLVSADELKNYRSLIKPFLCSPLIINEQLLGVITISDKSSQKPFMQRELQVLEFLSRQIAFNYQRISMTHQLGQISLETHNLKKQIESQERLVSLGKLAGGIAHEFNNPLDGVMRYTNLSLGHVQDDEVLKEYLTEIQQGLKRMANIVRNLLACARNSPKSTQKIDINKTIEQALKELYPYLASKNINLVKNLTKQLPEITDWGIERVISNLVKNAIDAIDKNGTVEIATSLEDEYIKIHVSDTGKGISSEDLDRIFEPFFTTKEIDQGCGLGLTIVNEIVKYYNGKIKVKSSPNQGTTFIVKLPIKE